MTCEQVGDRVDDFVLDLLEPGDRSGVEAHLRSCAACGRALEKARRVLAVMNEWQATPPTARLSKPKGPTTRRTLPSAVPRPWIPALAAAAAILAVIAIVVSAQGRRPSQEQATMGERIVPIDVPPVPIVDPEQRVPRPEPEPRPVEKADPPPSVVPSVALANAKR